MPARPTDDELAAHLADEYERQEKSRRNNALMNALIRGLPAPGDDRPTQHDEEPADMNEAIRKAAGRPYQAKPKDAQ